ncbi:hypothetical protein G7Y89_g2901 [Cudoniella acicularis]|uniref:MYND-type domain-containing protein n=1 Tax=Cudoniella acicularis TaxID=354080 RepID=A0A8H4RSF3_9HELO|nr:hypothetical protein G7Y89_g2901 [Cudoniella acicularis]
MATPPAPNTEITFPLPAAEPFYKTGTFWKHFSVLVSIGLSIASLIISAFASLRRDSISNEVLRALTVSGIVVNSISISLSALTSLDWKSKTTNDRLFAEQLVKVVHVHEGERIVVLRKGQALELETGRGSGSDFDGSGDEASSRAKLHLTGQPGYSYTGEARCPPPHGPEVQSSCPITEAWYGRAEIATQIMKMGIQFTHFWRDEERGLGLFVSWLLEFFIIIFILQPRLDPINNYRCSGIVYLSTIPLAESAASDIWYPFGPNFSPKTTFESRTRRMNHDFVHNHHRRCSSAGGAVVLPVFALGFLAARLYTKRVLVRNIDLSDYSIVLAFLLAFTNSIIQICLTKYGTGIHIWNITSENFKIFMRTGDIYGAIAYNMGTFFIKASIILFYLRLSAHRPIRIVIYVVMFVTVGYNLAGAITPFYICTPMRFYWDSTIPGKCIDLNSNFLATAAFNVATDIALLLLPIWLLRPLCLPTKQKICVIIVLMTGSALLEMYTGIICVCLPSMKPLMKHHFPKLFEENYTITYPTFQTIHHLPTETPQPQPPRTRSVDSGYQTESNNGSSSQLKIDSVNFQDKEYEYKSPTASVISVSLQLPANAFVVDKEKGSVDLEASYNGNINTMEAIVQKFNNLPRVNKAPSSLVNNDWHFSIRHVPLDPPGDLLIIVNPGSHFVCSQGPKQILSLPSNAAKADIIVSMLLEAFISGVDKGPDGKPLPDIPPFAPWTWSTKDTALIPEIEARLTALGVRPELRTVRPRTHEENEISDERWAGLAKALMDSLGLGNRAGKGTVFNLNNPTGVICGGCKKDSSAFLTPLQRCARCREVFYCSRDCQKSDWKQHKNLCGKDPKESGPSVSPLDYWNNTAHTSPEARALASSINLTLPQNGVNESGLMMPMRRLIIAGKDTPENLQLLLGPKWKEEQSIYEEYRLEVLLQPPRGSPSYALTASYDDGVPTPSLQPATAEESEKIQAVRDMQARISRHLGSRKDPSMRDMQTILSSFGANWDEMVPIYQLATNTMDQNVQPGSTTSNGLCSPRPSVNTVLLRAIKKEIEHEKYEKSLVVLEIILSALPSVESIEHLKTQMLAVMPYEQVGLSKIRQIDEKLKAACDFQNLLVIQPREHSGIDNSLLGPRVKKFINSGVFDTYPLIMDCTLNADGLSATTIFDSAIIKKSQMNRIILHFQHILKQPCSKEEDRTVQEINTISPAAICSWDGDFTRGELDDLASKLANHLIKQGVGPETRLVSVVKQIDAQIVLCPAELEKICSVTFPSMKIAVVDGSTLDRLPSPTTPGRSDVGPSNALYVIFTSGTAGTPKEEERMSDLAGAIARMNVNAADVTPSYINTISPDVVPSLRRVTLSGEPITANIIKTWAEKVHLINAYGMTECCVTSLVNANVSAKTNPANIGHGVGAGYETKQYRRPGRVYKTGNLAQYNPDGSINSLGRVDTQAKLRGQRIELGEIEHHLLSSPSVRNTMVVLPTTGSYQGQIIGLVELEGLQHATTQDGIQVVPQSTLAAVGFSWSSLSDHLRNSIPAYMIPSSWIPIDHMPLHTSGKLDRSKLLAWLSVLPTDHQIDHEPQENGALPIPADDFDFNGNQQEGRGASA